MLSKTSKIIAILLIFTLTFVHQAVLAQSMKYAFPNSIYSKEENQLQTNTESQNKLQENYITEPRNQIDNGAAEPENQTSNTTVEKEGEANNQTAEENNIIVEIDRKRLSSTVENKDVTITVKLNNTSKNMYKDPIIDIILPEEVEDVNIKQANLLYAEGLKIKETKRGTIAGKQAIRVIIEGTQTGFSSVLTKGTNLVVEVDLKLKELSPNIEREIEVNCTNQNEITGVQQTNTKTSKVGVSITAPEEVISISTIKTDDEGKEVTSLRNEKQAGKIEILAEAKTKQMELKVLNNYKTPVTGVTILGRFMAEGNKSPEKIDLGSNFSTTLKSKIQTNIKEAQIYYSEDINAGKTLNGTWKTAENIDLNKAKSYLIVFPEDYRLEAAQSLNFTYDFEVPEMLEHNSESYGTYTTYYTREENISETALSNIVGVSTGTGPQLKVELTSNIEEGAVVREGQRITYTIKVTNTGREEAKNVVVTFPIPENTYGVTYDGKNYYADTETQREFTIESIPTGKSETFTVNIEVDELPTLEEYYNAQKDENGKYYTEKVLEHIKLEKVETESESNVKVEGKYYHADYDITEETQTEIVEENGIYYVDIIEKEYVTLQNIPITAVAKVKAEGLQKAISSNELTLKAVESEINIITSVDDNMMDTIAYEGDKLEYFIAITNTAEKDLENLKLDMQINNALTYKRAYIQDYIEEKYIEIELENIYKNNSISYTIPKLEIDQTITIVIETEASNLGTAIEKTASMTPKVTIGNITYTGNSMDNKIARAKLEAVQTCSEQNSYIKEGDTYSYELTIENSGIVPTKNLKIEMNIPEELLVQDMYYELAGTKIGMAKTNKREAEICIPEGETLKIVIKVLANKIDSRLTEKKITNSFKITESKRNIEVNSISHTIEVNPNWEGVPVQKPDTQSPNDPSSPSSPSNPSSPSTPGQKTYKISGKVWLDQNKNGKYESEESLLKDIAVSLINEAGDILKTTKTGESGSYTFAGIEKGKYIVVFVYDSNVYALTYYQKEGVAESLNSDVIGDKGNAITDTIEITDTSIGNINMGLITKETFDLKLDKYVSRIVVQTSNGTKEYTQGNKTTLAKADIRAKELKGAKVIMEYKIVITNEGKTAGYAKEIVDYIPNDTEFSSELNSGWYQGSDGELHTTQLKDIVINPGESIALYLVLSRNMTEKNTNTITNNAEIQKSYSIEQVEDTDSIAGNKKAGEDDIGSADIIIGVATGSRVLYITLGIVCMLLLVEGIYFIKKKVLMK